MSNPVATWEYADCCQSDSSLWNIACILTNDILQESWSCLLVVYMCLLVIYASIFLPIDSKLTYPDGACNHYKYIICGYVVTRSILQYLELADQLQCRIASRFWLDANIVFLACHQWHHNNKAIRDGRPRPPRHQGFIAISYGGSELRHRSILETITHRPKCQIQKL